MIGSIYRLLMLWGEKHPTVLNDLDEVFAYMLNDIQRQMENTYRTMLVSHTPNDDYVWANVTADDFRRLRERAARKEDR